IFTAYRYVILTVGIGILIFFHVYIGFAIAHSFHTAKPLVVLTCLAYAGLFYFFVLKQYLLKLKKPLQPIANCAGKIWNYELCGLFPVFKTAAVAAVIAAFLIWIIIDSKDSRIRLRSVAGMAMYLILAVICSANPARIKWRPVICSLILQFCIGLIVLKWPAGHSAFQWLSNKVVRFLDYTVNGTSFTYGLVASPPNICGFGSVFIYTSLQIIIYFGAIVSVLYYLGVIEFVLSRIAWLMQYTLGTTAAESLNAAACIFLGQTEAAILIEPALNTMTESEIHAVMSAGFACIAGSLFSAYISFGACPSYLLSATVMSAAVSLAVSKIIYPEIQQSRQKSIGSFKFKDRGANNILECISNGACHSSKFVWAIGANLIVYLALLALLNTVVWWLGDTVGIKDLSFNKILGYCFFPLAYMMGASDASDSHTQIDETLKVAELMGMKTVLNEFIAYQHLHSLVETGELVGDRARMIATYALCGFSNISMIGSQMGILSSMCPHRKSTFAKVVVRALIAGCISCFMTACVAGTTKTVYVTCLLTVQHF
uniref:Sodium/nucleoside cotransporter n=1 Tax=Syphacia muris TaxID=451379 RepID=A0A0N5AJH0_9BILA